MVQFRLPFLSCIGFFLCSFVCLFVCLVDWLLFVCFGKCVTFVPQILGELQLPVTPPMQSSLWNRFIHYQHYAGGRGGETAGATVTKKKHEKKKFARMIGSLNEPCGCGLTSSIIFCSLQTTYMTHGPLELR